MSDAAGDPERALAAATEELIAGLDCSVPAWASRQVQIRAAQAGLEVHGRVSEVAARAGRATHAEVMPRLRALLETDVDQQRGNPLALLRAAVGPATAALRELGVPPVERDEFAQQAFPDDPYDIGPASFADIDEALHEAGLRWGAAKAFVHLRRRRSSS